MDFTCSEQLRLIIYDDHFGLISSVKFIESEHRVCQCMHDVYSSSVVVGQTEHCDVHLQELIRDHL